jgi:hypothetical protein
MRLTPKQPTEPTSMTDKSHPNGTETRPNDHQRAVEACEHAVDALRNGYFTHARTLLEEAHAAVERVQSGDTPTQEQRETVDQDKDRYSLDSDFEWVNVQERKNSQ